MGYLVDTSAWIEYLRGTELGHVAARYIEGEDQIITHTLVVAELRRVYARDRRTDFDDHLAFIQVAGSLHYWLDVETAVLAGDIRQSEAIAGTSLVDCIQVAVARREGHLVLVKDTQFRSFPEALVLEDL